MSNRQYIFSETLTKDDIKSIRKKLKLTQKAFAELVNVSVKTVERWEISDTPITGPIVPLVTLLEKNLLLQAEISVPQKNMPLRLWYYYKNMVCSIIDVDEQNRNVKVYNYTNNLMKRAFGCAKEVTFEDYEEFLKSRCFPNTRDKMKLILRDLDLPFYDPLLIIEKTKGKMAEDDFWIRIERE